MDDDGLVDFLFAEFCFDSGESPCLYRVDPAGKAGKPIPLSSHAPRFLGVLLEGKGV